MVPARLTASGRPIGTDADPEGKVHMESNTWAVLSGAASAERGKAAMDSVDEWLFTPYGLMLNAPAYSKPDDEVGFVTRVYKGLKENGSIFSHPNPWAWAAECVLGRGERLWDGLEGIEERFTIEATPSPQGVVHMAMNRRL